MTLDMRNSSSEPYGNYTISLVYRYEAILLLEIRSPSLCTILAIKLTTEKYHQLRLEELEMLDEKQLQPQQRVDLYQTRISKIFHKRVKKRVFHQEDLVLAVKTTYGHDAHDTQVRRQV